MGKAMRYLAGGAIVATLATASLRCNNEDQASRGFGAQWMPMIGAQCSASLETRAKEIPKSELGQIETTARSFLEELRTNRSKYPDDWFADQLKICVLNDSCSITRYLYAAALYTHDTGLGIKSVAALARYPTESMSVGEHFKEIILRTVSLEARDPKVAAAAKEASLKLSRFILKKCISGEDWPRVYDMAEHSVHPEIKNKAINLTLNHGGLYALKYVAIHSSDASKAEGALDKIASKTLWGEVRDVAENAQNQPIRAKALKALENSGSYSEIAGVAEDSNDEELVNSAIAVLIDKGQDESILEVLRDAAWSGRLMAGKNAITALVANKKWEVIAGILEERFCISYDQYSPSHIAYAYEMIGKQIPDLALAGEYSILKTIALGANDYETRQAALDSLIKAGRWQEVRSVAEYLEYGENSQSSELRDRALGSLPLYERICTHLDL